MCLAQRHNAVTPVVHPLSLDPSSIPLSHCAPIFSLIIQGLNQDSLNGGGGGGCHIYRGGWIC